jgi:DNA mismatch repair ATPase MutS
MGCFVPCEEFVLSPVDRIFTRLGAEDKILEEKSTFFIEMEETKSILSYLIKLKCKALFSTHYHMLIDKFKKKKGVERYCMGYEEGTDDN